MRRSLVILVVGLLLPTWAWAQTVDVRRGPVDPLGLNADSAVTPGSTGSISGKLRQMSADIDALVDSLGASDDAAASGGGTGTAQAKLRKISADLGSILTALQTLAGAVQGTEVQADVLTVPADPFGTNADAAATAGSTGSISAKLRRATADLAAVMTALGATDDAAATAGGTGTVSAKLRQLSADLDAVKTALAAGIDVNVVSGTIDVGEINIGAVKLTTGTESGQAIITDSTPASDAFGVVVRNIPSGTQAVSGTVSVSGTVTVGDGSGPLTVDGTVAATQSGTWTVQPGNTANTTAWLVTGTGGTFPATQSGSWTVTANAGTNLNTSALALESGGNLAGAATSLAIIDDWDESDRAKVNIIVGQAGVTAGAGNVAANTPRVTLATDDPGVTHLDAIETATETLAGAVSASKVQVDVITAPLPTDAATESEQQTQTGHLADIKTAVEGTLTADANLHDGLGNALTSQAAGSTRPLHAIIVDTDGNPVTFGGGEGSGGTSSNFTSSFPAAGTAAGFSDGTNMQGARVFDADSGGGTQYVLGVNLRIAGSGGSVEGGTASNPIRVDPTGTTTQPVSGTVTANAGSGTFTVSGTVTANAGTNLNTSALALESGGNLATTATALTRAQGSTTSGQTGPLVQGAVTTNAPTYTTGQTSPLSLTTSGAQRVDLNSVKGSAIATGNGAVGSDTLRVTIGTGSTGTIGLATGSNTIGSLVANQSVNTAQVGGNNISTNSGNVGTGVQRVVIATDQPSFTNAMPVTAAQATASNLNAHVQGPAASNAAKAGNPVQIGGVFNTTQPTVDSGDVVEAQATARGAMIVAYGIDGLVPGTSATMLGKAVDSAAGATDTGVAMLAVRRDTLSALTPADGDYARPSLDSTGALWVKQSGTVTVDGSGVTQPISAASLPLPTGAATNSAVQDIEAAIRESYGTAGSPSSTVLTTHCLNCGGGSDPATETKQDAIITLLAAGLPSALSSDRLKVETQANAGINIAQYGGSGVGTGNALHVQPGTGASFTVAQGTASNLNATVVGTGTFAVQSAQSGTWTVQPGNTANTTAWLVTGTGGTFPATQSGTWTVQPGNTPNSTPWLVTDNGATSGGTSTCYITSAASTNATNCKNAAGQLYNITLVNTTATAYYLRLYNTSSSPTCSSATGFVGTIPALATGGVSHAKHVGQAFSTGISFCLTGGGSSTDNTNAATGVYVMLEYK